MNFARSSFLAILLAMASTSYGTESFSTTSEELSVYLGSNENAVTCQMVGMVAALVGEVAVEKGMRDPEYAGAFELMLGAFISSEPFEPVDMGDVGAYLAFIYVINNRSLLTKILSSTDGAGSPAEGALMAHQAINGPCSVLGEVTTPSGTLTASQMTNGFLEMYHKL